VPRIFGADDIPEDDDDLEAWSSFSSREPRWRGEGGPTGEEEWDDFSRLADDETRIGALAGDQPGHPDDFFSFDEYEEPAEVPVAETGGRRRRAFSDESAEQYPGEPPDPGPLPPASAPPRSRRPAGGPGGGGGGAYARPANAGRDVPVAIGVGLGFGVVALLAFAAGGKFTVALITLVLAGAAVELLNVLRQAGYQPAVLLGIAACTALPLAAYYKGEVALPVVLFLTVVFGLIWYLAGAGGDDRPVIGLSSTLLAVCYIGVLGSFAALMLKLGTTADGIGDPGIGVLLGAVIATIGYDVGGFVVGRNAGSRPLSAASPNKTVEGLLGGVLGAVLVSVIVVGRIEPWGSFSDALLLGVAVAIAAPLGDLAESLLKRDLDVKDMGTILPGHGGLLDRFDALLFVLPTAYYVARIALF
jgi:phosphatidate cytidylyltransferase